MKRKAIFLDNESSSEYEYSSDDDSSDDDSSDENDEADKKINMMMICQGKTDASDDESNEEEYIRKEGPEAQYLSREHRASKRYYGINKTLKSDEIIELSDDDDSTDVDKLTDYVDSTDVDKLTDYVDSNHNKDLTIRKRNSDELDKLDVSILREILLDRLDEKNLQIKLTS